MDCLWHEGAVIEIENFVQSAAMTVRMASASWAMDRGGNFSTTIGGGGSLQQKNTGEADEHGQMNILVNIDK